MTTYTIEMHRTPGLSDAERRRRLSEAFDVLFSFKNRKMTADRDSRNNEARAMTSVSARETECNLEDATNEKEKAQLRQSGTGDGTSDTQCR
jgi:hypothetical protein